MTTHFSSVAAVEKLQRELLACHDLVMEIRRQRNEIRRDEYEKAEKEQVALYRKINREAEMAFLRDIKLSLDGGVAVQGDMKETGFVSLDDRMDFTDRTCEGRFEITSICSTGRRKGVRVKYLTGKGKGRSQFVDLGDFHNARTAKLDNGRMFVRPIIEPHKLRRTT